jgi:hypothetical protein
VEESSSRSGFLAYVEKTRSEDNLLAAYMHPVRLKIKLRKFVSSSFARCGAQGRSLPAASSLENRGEN